MSLKDLRPRHLRLISLYSSRYAVRGGTGVVFLLLTLACGLFVAYLIIDVAIGQQKEMLADQGYEVTEEQLLQEMLKVARPAVQWAIGSSGTTGEEDNEEKEWTSYLLDSQPALLSAVLLILIFTLPFVVVTGAFNQFSGDIASRGLRYQLLRTARANIFFGRFLGTSLFAICVMALLITTIVVYLGLKTDLYDWGPLLIWGLRGLAALAILCVPYVALCSWISCAIDSPLGSLVIAALVVGVVPLFALIARGQFEWLAYISYSLPWGAQNYLLHHEALYVFGAIAACLGYTVVFLFLGYRHFSRRDL